MKQILLMMQKLIIAAIAILSLSSCLDECDIYLPVDSGYISIDVLISTKDTVQYAYVRKSYNSTVSADTLDAYDKYYHKWLYFQLLLSAKLF